MKREETVEEVEKNTEWQRRTPKGEAGGSIPFWRTIERISEPYIVWGTVFVQTKRHSLP